MPKAAQHHTMQPQPAADLQPARLVLNSTSTTSCCVVRFAPIPHYCTPSTDWTPGTHLAWCSCVHVAWCAQVRQDTGSYSFLWLHKGGMAHRSTNQHIQEHVQA